MYPAQISSLHSPMSLRNPVLLGKGGAVHLCSLFHRNILLLSETNLLWRTAFLPFPDQSFQLCIHLRNIIYIKHQHHIMEESITNTIESQPSACKTQYSYKRLSDYCLYLKSLILSLPQLAGNTSFPHLCTGGREQPTEMWGPLPCWEWELPCACLPLSGGDAILWLWAREHDFS